MSCFLLNFQDVIRFLEEGDCCVFGSLIDVGLVDVGQDDVGLGDVGLVDIPPQH